MNQEPSEIVQPVPQQPAPGVTKLSGPRTKLTVKRQFMQLVGTNIRTFDEAEQLVCFAHAKAFKLREEIIFYADEAKTTPMFHTKARNIIDIAPTYDMFDNNGTLFGSLRRQGIMSSFAQDHWLILDSAGNQIGDIMEDSLMLGILRRHVDFVAYFMPQTYSVKFGQVEVAEIKQRKNPLLVRYEYDLDSESWQKYRLLFLAIANLLALIEARQN